MTILITGATGFVMSSLARCLAEGGHAVVAADLKPPDPALRGFLDGLPGRVRFRQVDVADAGAVRAVVEEVRPERAVHGAAVTAIPAEIEQARFVDVARVNVMGTLNVLEALRATGAGRVVVVSSGSVYGARADLDPVGEDAPANPEGVYALTKWAAEALARRFAEVHRVDLAVVRLASPFGPFERDTGSRPLLSLIHGWARAALGGEPLRIVGPPSQRRDHVHVADVATGVAAVVLGERLPHDVYNVGWGRTASADEVVAALGRLVPRLKIEHHPDQPSPWGVLARGPLESSRLRHDLGWTPRYDLDSGLAAYLEWLRSGREG